MTSTLEPKIEKQKDRPIGSKNKLTSKQAKRPTSAKRNSSTFEKAKTSNKILSQASVNKKLPHKRKKSRCEVR